ncbi:GNAT family N-acetyltransferase [Nocardioides sp. S-58]|uniref:GNAT family N-acetyltransferase n=1 Tax=Nocardioides renjunii TaxID=3095075 RepID=A0ABU5KCY6_9ACTN|nr:GNAT family N-acetyltransferase [Nocardioides sp. S-58]MDZ5662304.1 GNAT family N-acetyltransferase [Nocardioides sp. S-58]
MLELVVPSPSFRESWLESRDEWGKGVPQSNSGLTVDTVDSVEGFRVWTERLRAEADHGVPSPTGRVHATNLWVVEDGAYAGAIQVRHYLNDALQKTAAHIGYGIRPSARGRGIATWALREALPIARELGLDRVLVTCDSANVASRRVIERNGGALEDERPTSRRSERRYSILLGGR